MERCGGKGLVLGLVLAASVFGAAGCGGGGHGGSDNAHVNPASGSTHELILDEREGTPPAPVKTANLKKAAKAAGCYLFQNVKPQNVKEIAPGAPAPKYASDPPLSGPYVEPPHQQADGAYLVGPEPADVVGSLNNGRMAIEYAPDLAEASQLELKGLFDTMYGGALLFPNESMAYALVATTWTNILGCPTFEPGDETTLDAIRDFGKATWGKYGNVPVHKYPPVGPTPAEPREPGKSE